VRLYRTTRDLAKALAALPADREPSLADLAGIPREFYSIEEMDLPDEEPLAGELKSFVEAARARGETAVPGEDGVRAMKAADAVIAEMRNHRWS
jgi:predicted dehydrogenase